MGDSLYLHFIDPGYQKAVFPIAAEIASAKYLATGKPVNVERTKSGDAVVSIKRDAGSKFDIVVELVLGK